MGTPYATENPGSRLAIGTTLHWLIADAIARLEQICMAGGAVQRLPVVGTQTDVPATWVLNINRETFDSTTGSSCLKVLSGTALAVKFQNWMPVRNPGSFGRYGGLLRP